MSSTLLAAPPAAHACHEEQRSPYYESPVNVAVMVGISFLPRVTFVHGLDLRFGRGPAAPFARVEGRGITWARAAGGVLFLESHGGASGELGLAAHTGRRGEEVGRSAGLHAALGAWSGGGTAAQLQGTLPFLGDRRNYDVSLAGIVVPGETRICFPSGRALRADEAVLLPSVLAGAASLDSIQGDCDRGRERAALAEHYREASRAEYASIWAFHRLAAELAIVGAPAALVEAAIAAADDEHRHALLCLQRAALPFALQPLSERARAPRFGAATAEALETLAREAWVDGCLGEGVAAAQAGAAAPEARGAAAEAQTIIAGDERRHAELSWQVLGWLWRTGRAPARDAIAACAEEPSPPFATQATTVDGRSDTTAADLDEGWLAAHGRIRPAVARHVAEDEAERARRRLARLLAS